MTLEIFMKIDLFVTLVEAEIEFHVDIWYVQLEYS